MRTLMSHDLSNKAKTHNTILGLDTIEPYTSDERTAHSDGYYLGKMTRRHAAASANREPMGAGVEIMSDIIGKMPVPSLKDAYEYAVVFKCRQTKFRDIYFLKTKDELLIRFKQFLADAALVDKQINKLVCTAV